MAKQKKYRVELIIYKEVVRIVYATSERQAISKAKKVIKDNPPRITGKDFEECYTIDHDIFYHNS